MLEIEHKFSWSLAVAANSKEVLEDNLLRSQDIYYAKEVLVKWFAPSAAAAYNAALRDCTADLIVFAHQDVFLPAGWNRKFCNLISKLFSMDATWGVAGLYGVEAGGGGRGHVYSAGLRRFVGLPLSTPKLVRTLDEMLLVVRRTAGLNFDEQLPGFHLYGTDICLVSEARGLRNYVLPCFAMHNSNGVDWLPWSFWRAYLYLRRKWRDRLPVVTPCTAITSGCTPVFEHIVQKCWSVIRGSEHPGERVNDPERFYLECLAPTLDDLCSGIPERK